MSNVVQPTRVSQSDLATNARLRATISRTILDVIIKAYQEGRIDFVLSLGVSAQTAEKLCGLSISQVYNLADDYFDIHVADRSLEILINRTLLTQRKVDLEHVAIKLGATRKIMQKYANMTSEKYMQKLALLGEQQSQKRNKPKRLSHEQTIELHDCYTNYRRNDERANEVSGADNAMSKTDHLRLLVHLAEKTNLSISRIYSYYYLDLQM